MSRLQQIRIIDTAIASIAAIAENQCSLSEDDLIIVNEALSRLKNLRHKKGKTNSQIQEEIASVVFLLIKFFSS